MKNKENNFISAVVYMHNCENTVDSFLSMINNQLSENFNKYEIVIVNDNSRDKSLLKLKEFAKSCQGAPITIVNMSLHQGIELCMNAGLDISIGDFVLEFETMETGYNNELIMQAYQKALTGYDIVCVSPAKSRSYKSKLFYRLFNSSINSNYKVQSDIFRVLSRRAINRVHAISQSLPYRKAAYATSGLKMETIFASNFVLNKSATPKFSLALDALAMYTNAAYKLSLSISGIMLLVTLLELIYTIYTYVSFTFFNGTQVVEGWTTTMLVLSGGFFGVFLIFSIVIKYLSLLVELIFKQQKYLVEGIEKL